MQIIEPVATRIEPASGKLGGANGHYTKRIEELDGCYADVTAFADLKARRGADIAYSVDQYSSSTDGHDVIFGTSTLEPGRVGDEYFMTRGHLHKKADRPEIYHGIAGQGVMLMQALDGRIAALELLPGVVVYVPPYWIHRSVNVGPERLVTLFCYPADAGQNYDIIRAAGGMAELVVADGAGWKTAPNPHYHRLAANGA